MLTLKRQATRAIIASLAVGTAMTFAASNFAQAQSAPGISQATTLNYKNVRDACKGTVDFAQRQAKEASTASELAKLDRILHTLTLFKMDYKTTATVKSNMQGVQEMRIAQAYSTILELQLVSGELSGVQHFKPVFESVARCQKEIERLHNRKIAVDEVELSRIFEPYYKLVKPLEEAKEILADFDSLYQAYLKLNPVPAGATDSQMDDAEYKAAIQAVEAILSQ